MSLLGFQYAEALFEIANENKATASIQSTFQSFSESIDKDAYDFLTHPKVTKKDKKQIIEQVVSDDLFKHFLFVLIDNNRFNELEDIFKEYLKIINTQHKIMQVRVYSRKSLSKVQKDHLIENLSKKHNRKIELENIVDQTIVGGIKVEYEGHVLDDTINSYLGNLKANLTR